MIRLLVIAFTVVAAAICISSCKVEQTVEPEYFIENYQWQEGTTAETGLVDSILYAGMSKASLTPFINSVLIIKNNKLVTSGYYHGTGGNTVFDIKSVTKSFMSTFIGMAIDKGILSLDSKLTDFFPEYKEHAVDNRINNITVRHLLTMTGGFKPDDAIYPLVTTPDWTQYILSFTLDNDPGTYYRYSDAGAYLLSAILTKATGKNTFEFAKMNFFNPLNFALQGWYQTSTGVPVGGAGMMFTPKNVAVLGLLFLNKGKLNGTQIVSENWVNEATKDQVGWQNEEWGAIKKLGYGYLWWVGEMNGRKIYSAIGYAGQFVFCIPDANMIVAISSNSEVYSAEASTQSSEIISLISQYFIRAIK